MRATTLMICIGLLTASAHAADAPLPQGHILLLKNCPGDTLPTAAQEASGREAFWTALLTPLLGGVINNSLKAVGTSLQEAAAEAQVDAITTGDHFYVTDTADVSKLMLKFNCIVLATKGTKATDQTLSSMVQTYHSATLKWDDFGRPVVESWTANPAKLVEELNNLGYDKTSRPALVVVFDVELAPSRTDVRLVPRFITLNHSIREKKQDTKTRDITFEFKFSASGGAAVMGTELFKFDSLVINAPRRRLATFVDNPSGDGTETTLLMPGQWFPLPAVSESVKNRISAQADAKAQMAVENQAARFAYAAAKALGDKTLTSDQCLTGNALVERWANINAQLLVEQVKKPSDQNAGLVAQLTQVATFHGACHRRENAKKKSETSVLRSGEPFIAVDIAVNVKEFRERPAAKFFGDLLTNDDTRKGMTTAIMGAIDPGIRAADAKTEAAANLALRLKYEDAILAAEQATLVHAAAKEEEKATKYLDMEYKKRAANRLADDLKLPRPYPASGAWISG